MPVARNGDVEIAYEVHGDGPPLLLIMGLGYARWGWHVQIPELSRDHRVIAMDNRGVGSSTPVTDPYTVHDMADDAVAVLDDAGVDTANVLGVSLGGVIAQSIAARYPQRVRTLFLLSTTHGGPAAVPVPAETAAVMLDPAPELTPEQRIRRVMPLSFRPGWTEEHPEEFDRIVALRLAHVPSFDAYVAQATAGGTADVTAECASITAPTLVAHGTADRVVPVENAYMLAERIEGARLEILEGAGHLIMIEDPDWLHALIREHRR
ncbi:MAG TPA: alpha/beta fold hydrolase [Actinomycetota bacterium]|nr:alpha/beta fold hydrolase [Actinomycetota bacterium]